MLKMSYAGCPGPSPAILAQFTLKIGVAVENRNKIHKTKHYFGGSRSFKVIDVDTNKNSAMHDITCKRICALLEKEEGNSVTISCYDKQHDCAYLQLFSRYTR